MDIDIRLPRPTPIHAHACTYLFLHVYIYIYHLSYVIYVIFHTSYTYIVHQKDVKKTNSPASIVIKKKTSTAWGCRPEVYHVTNSLGFVWGCSGFGFHLGCLGFFNGFDEILLSGLTWGFMSYLGFRV